MQVRRNHVAEIIGNQMIIHGGINENEGMQNDTYLLNFKPLKWIELHINENTPGPYLAYHCSCLVLPHHIRISSKLSVYRVPETKKNLMDTNVIKND